VDQISQAILQLDQVIQQNAANSEQLAATSEELASQAEQLQATMAFFRNDGSGATVVRRLQAPSAAAGGGNGNGKHKPLPESARTDGGVVPAPEAEADMENVRTA